jgi:ppGpp synthetase/RelA/SpoT-type nucleotidyltranferase
MPADPPVLPSKNQLKHAGDRIRRGARGVERAGKLELVRVRDYNELPHRGGYRALHLWCRRDGLKVEIQLRTSRQHDWAEAVEECDAWLGMDLKHEQGPDELLVFFRELADYHNRLDRGVTPSELDVSALRAARSAVRAWLTTRMARS